MLLTIVTVIAVLFMVGIPVYAIRRGSANIFFVGLCVILSGVAANAIGQAVAQAQGVGGSQLQITQGSWSLWVFVPLFLASFPLGNYLSRFYPFNFDPFDFMFSVMFGLVVAFFALRVTLGALVDSRQNTPLHPELTSHYVVRQVVYLDGWNTLAHSVTTLYDKSTEEKKKAIDQVD